jgi:urocanate hydratase
MTMIARSLRAPRGTSLTCLGWPQEAALRMLMNNLDPEVAERPDELIVYGGTGKARAIVGRVRRDRAIAQVAGARRNAARPIGQAGRHFQDASRRAARAHRQRNLVPKWATWDTFRDLEDRGLTMYGQMTAAAGSISGRRAFCRAPTRRWRGRRRHLAGR